MVSLFFSQHNGVVSPSMLLIVNFWGFLGFFLGFLIAHECDHLLGSLLTYKLLCWAIILSPYTPPRKPASGLVLCSGDDAIDGDWSWSDTAPLYPLINYGGPPVKFRPGSLYDGAALIAPEDGNTLRALVRSQRWCPVVFLLGSLSIKAYMCRLSYVQNRVLLLRPMRDRGVVTMSLCRFFGIPEACREEQRAGYFTEWHWVWDIVVATSGYSKDFLWWSGSNTRRQTL